MTIQTRRFRRARTRNLPTYLFVAHADDLNDVQLTCQTLPICAHGRLFIVAPDGLPNVSVPPRLSVTVLPTLEAAERAVSAWMSEMMTGVYAWFTDSVHEISHDIIARHEISHVKHGAVFSETE